MYPAIEEFLQHKGSIAITSYVSVFIFLSSLSHTHTHTHTHIHCHFLSLFHTFFLFSSYFLLLEITKIVQNGVIQNIIFYFVKLSNLCVGSFFSPVFANFSFKP